MLKDLRFRWKNRLLPWLEKRIPANFNQRLNHSSIFIFPSEFGLGFLFMCACLFVLGTNYQNNLMLFLCYFLLAIFLLNLFVSYLNFSKLQFKAQPIGGVFAGHLATLNLKLVINGKPEAKPSGNMHLQWWNENDSIWIDLDKHDNLISKGFYAEKRGVFTLPRLKCFSYYPLGLYRCWTYLDFDQTLWVYPTPIACKTLLSNDETQVSETNTTSVGHDDFYALKAYSAGDPLQHVAWKHVARTGEWTTKSFSQPLGSSGYLVLPNYYKDIETELSKLAFQVIELSQQQIPFGLKLGATSLPPDNSENHKLQCLKALAEYAAPTTPKAERSGVS